MLRSVLACLAFLLFASLAPARADIAVIETASGTHRFDVEIAATSAERNRGLMFRRSLADDAGMLFDFGGEQEVSMWMANTYIPLDMIFIRADGIVHRIERRTTPFSHETIASRGPVRYVLEIAGGAAERIGLNPGDRIQHPLIAGAD